MPKYANPGRLLVDVVINGVMIEGYLVDSGAAMSVMMMQTMHKLNLTKLLKRTQTILQLADRSTTVPECILEDIVVTMVEWDYSGDFLVLKPKKEGGYPMISGRPLLATTDAKLGMRFGELEIAHGSKWKCLSMYPPARPMKESLEWIGDDGEEDEDLEGYKFMSSHLDDANTTKLMAFDHYAELKQKDENLDLYAWMQGSLNLSCQDIKGNASDDEDDELMQFALAQIDSFPLLGVQRIELAKRKSVLIGDQTRSRLNRRQKC